VWASMKSFGKANGLRHRTGKGISWEATAGGAQDSIGPSCLADNSLSQLRGGGEKKGTLLQRKKDYDAA